MKRLFKGIADGIFRPANVAYLKRAFGVAEDGERVAARPAAPELRELARRTFGVDRGTQILLVAKYRELLAAGRTDLLDFADVGFRAFSQNDEDGILLYLFSLVGATNRKVVEICAGNGIECNAANLIINHGWDGLLVDCDENLLRVGRTFYGGCLDTRRLPPQLVQAWVTRDNVNELVRSHGMAGEVDLLVLDMDGMDYWIWAALDTVDPRVVLLEYNNRWPADQAVTVPYQEDFAVDKDFDYFGASLAAFAKLGKQKGYRLVGSNRFDTNAVFLREGVGDAVFPEVPVADCLGSPYARRQHEQRYPLIRERETVAV